MSLCSANPLAGAQRGGGGGQPSVTPSTRQHQELARMEDGVTSLTDGDLRAIVESHFKLFGSDGVSLQSQELGDEMRRRQRLVFPVASDVPVELVGLRLADLSYQLPAALDLRHRLFPKELSASPGQLNDLGAALVQEVGTRARAIRKAIEQYLVTIPAPFVVHVRNIMSLPYNLPATVAFHGLASERPDLPFVFQHHDIYWEGPNAATFDTPFPAVRALIDRVICPDLPNVVHSLINPAAADALATRKGLSGLVVPDGFDFNRSVPRIDTTEFRRNLEILAGDHSRPVNDGDLVVAMPARVAINKAIELSIQFVAALQRHRDLLEAAPDGLGRHRRQFGSDSRIVLVLPQGEDIAECAEYLSRLISYANQLGVTVAYGGSIVDPDKKYTGAAGRYPFYATYQAMDFVAYMPEHEGFGNQLIETVWAHVPFVLLEYDVFREMIADHLPHYISAGTVDELERTADRGLLHVADARMDRAAVEAIGVLTDHALEERRAAANDAALRAFCGIDRVASIYLSLYEEVRLRTARHLASIAGTQRARADASAPEPPAELG